MNSTTQNAQHPSDTPEAEAVHADANNGPKDEAAPETSAIAEIEGLKGEIADLKDRLLRSVAELENTRKRAERERNEAARYSIQRFAADLVGVSDNLSRALAAIPNDTRENETIKTLIAGVELTERELLSTFERHGIRKLNPKGEAFNPHLHQAVAEVPSNDVASGHVLEVIQPGYQIDERLIRAAMVVIAKSPPAAETQTPELPGERLDTSA